MSDREQIGFISMLRHLAVCCSFHLLTVLFFPSLVWGEEHPSPLTKLVDAEAGLVLRIQGFKQQIPAVLESEWMKSFLKSPLSTSLRESRDVQRILQAGRQIEEISGESLQNYLTQIFGEDVILAVYPGKGEGQSPFGVLYTTAESETSLLQTIARWKRLEAQTTTSFKHRGVEYTLRVPTRSRNPEQSKLFYCILGRHFILSEKEQAILNAIDLHLASGSPQVQAKPQTLADLPKYVEGRKRIPERFWATLYFSTPHWKHLWQELKQDPETGSDLKTLHAVLKRTDALMLGLRFEEGILGDLLVKMDEETAVWVQPFASIDSPATLTSHVGLPCIALVHLNLPGGIVSTLVSPLLQRKVPNWEHVHQILTGLFLGHDPLTEILPLLGPEWQVSLHPRRSMEDSRHPPCEILVEVPYQSGELTSAAGVKSSLQTTLANGIHSLLHLLALGESEKHRSTQIERTDENSGSQWQIRHQSHIVAAISLRPEALQAASAPELLETPLPTGSGLNQSPLWKESLARHAPTAANLVWIHLPELLSVPEAKISPEDPGVQFLQLFDVAWMSFEIRDGLLHASGGLQKISPPDSTAAAP